MPDSATKILRETGRKRQEVTLLLGYDEMITKCYCFYCENRSPIFAMQGHIFGVIYGNHIDPITKTVPLGFHCSKCGTLYFVAALNQ